MRRRGLIAVGVLLVGAAGSSLPAAEAAPGERWAIGGALGLISPIGSDEFDQEPALRGFAEYVQNEAIAWRGTVCRIDFGSPADSETGDIALLAFLANFVYRWDADSIHPMLTAGVGLYDHASEFGDDAMELGINLGGGVELAVHPKVGIELEASLHGTAGDEPDTFFSASVGARWRF